MKRWSIFVALVALTLSTTPAWGGAQKKADKATAEWRYDAEEINRSGKQGTAVFKIWSYSKNDRIAETQAAKNAVHAILFKGYGSNRPMVSPEAAEEHKEFFDSFFKEGGGYRKYVQLTNNGAVSPSDRIKVGKEWKIGVVVIVSKTQLRKELERQGIISKLGDMF